MDAKADDCMDTGGRATQDAKADVERYRDVFTASPAKGAARSALRRS